MDLTDELRHVAGRDCKAWLWLQVRKHHQELFEEVRGVWFGNGKDQLATLTEVVGFRPQYGHEADHDYVLQLWLWI